MDDNTLYFEALIKLHIGLERQGPGDADFSRFILEQIPQLPPNPRIADIGCGAGAGTLILAQELLAAPALSQKSHNKIKAVDFSRIFLDELMARANQKEWVNYIEPIERDMGNLDWEPGSIDLLWSEGAAYSITFEGALKAWRPLLSNEGIAAISEMNYFSENTSDEIKQFMKNLYPGIKTEKENIALINSSGFNVLGVHRLPSSAWWNNYYNPLIGNISAIKKSNDYANDKIMQEVIKETEEEMAYFKAHDTDYGYSFYIMQA